MNTVPDNEQKGPRTEGPADLKAVIEATTGCLKLLERLNFDGRKRAAQSIVSALGLMEMLSPSVADPRIAKHSSTASGRGDGKQLNNSFSDFPELYAAAHPDTNVLKALVASYWFQVCLGQDSVVSAEVNKELANVEGPLNNVTMAFEGLMGTKPQLVIQTRKSGSSQQARKTYRLTVAGIKAVEEMLNRTET